MLFPGDTESIWPNHSNFRRCFTWSRFSTSLTYSRVSRQRFFCRAKSCNINIDCFTVEHIKLNKNGPLELSRIFQKEERELCRFDQQFKILNVKYTISKKDMKR